MWRTLQIVGKIGKTFWGPLKRGAMLFSACVYLFLLQYYILGYLGRPQRIWEEAIAHRSFNISSPLFNYFACLWAVILPTSVYKVIYFPLFLISVCSLAALPYFIFEVVVSRLYGIHLGKYVLVGRWILVLVMLCAFLMFVGPL